MNAPNPTAPALSLSGVTVGFPDGPSTRTVLDSVDLVVNAGEFVVVSGLSGSGKSTLLSVAGLLRKPDAGEVTIAGTPTASLSEAKRTTVRRDHISFVFQSANLMPALTAVEQLELMGNIRGEKHTETRARALDLLAEVDLADRANQRPHQLSGGERQRVGIARALMAQPTILIADEPTASLDPDRAAIIAELLAVQSRKLNLATIVVAHDSATAEYADRRLELVGGKLEDHAVASGQK